DGVLEFFEQPKQIPLFLLEVSEGPNNPDLDKVNGDRKKLMDEGVFALNKFMISTELAIWKVCETLNVFLAQGFADKIEIGQLIFIGPGLYLFSPFTIPAPTIPTSFINLEHAPRLEGQRLIAKPKTKYATGFTPDRPKAVRFENFLPKISKETNRGRGRGSMRGRGKGV
ncbi:5785_t:CDS:2, partial [Entrophospora sp. SA101]